MTAARLTFVLCSAGLAAFAQYPGQYPPGQYPPGQYPPGTYPPGRDPRNPTGTNIPTGRTNKKDKNSKDSTIVTTTAGLVRRSVPSQIVIEGDDHRIIWYRTSQATKLLKNSKDADAASFAAGDHVTVDSTADDQGFFTAVEMRFEKAGTPSERAAASEIWDLPKLEGAAVASAKSAPSAPQREPGDDRPVLRRSRSDDDAKPEAAAKEDKSPRQAAKVETEEPVDTRPTTTLRPPDPPPDADDSGPPTLRHGAPPSRRPAALPPFPSGESSSGSVILVKPAEPEAAKPAPSVLEQRSSGDPIVEKAREAAAAYGSTLPNFFCQQMTTRYQSDHPKTGWDALDVVTAEVAYENGRESYKNIKVGNKAVNKRMEDIEGTRSTGEFASILEDLLSPASGATFRKSGTDSVHGRSTFVYKYDIPRERSHWRVEAPSQIYFPAHAGTIWIDKETSRVLRIEQQSRNMPKLFPFDTIETATDYDFVRLSATEPFLLPIDAEVLSCVRGSSMCMRNRIDFRNYRKFGAESNITFDPKQQ